MGGSLEEEAEGAGKGKADGEGGEESPAKMQKSEVANTIKLPTFSIEVARGNSHLKIKRSQQEGAEGDQTLQCTGGGGCQIEPGHPRGGFLRLPDDARLGGWQSITDDPQENDCCQPLSPQHPGAQGLAARLAPNEI